MREREGAVDLDTSKSRDIIPARFRRPGSGSHSLAGFVARRQRGGIAKWLRRRIANPLSPVRIRVPPPFFQPLPLGAFAAPLSQPRFFVFFPRVDLAGAFFAAFFRRVVFFLARVFVDGFDVELIASSSASAWRRPMLRSSTMRAI